MVNGGEERLKLTRKTWKERMAKDSKIERVEDMSVFRDFFDLALDVEKLTRRCDPEFRWLRNQALRSSESVCANMTEGFYSQYSTEYLQALYRCRREAHETVTHLQYAVSVKLLAQDSVSTISGRYSNALKQLSNLITSIERKIRQRGKFKSGLPAAPS